MQLLVRLNVQDARLWHRRLLERLARQDGVHVAVAPTADTPLSPWVERLLDFETVLHGLTSPHFFSRIDAEDLAPFAAAAAFQPDLVLDFGRQPTAGDGRVWQVVFDGAPGEAALADALLARQRPVVEIREGDAVLAAGRVGTDEHGVAAVSLDEALARTISLVAGAVGGARPQLPAADIPSPSPHRATRAADVARIAAKSLARMSLRSVYRMVYRSPHWRVGWRLADTDALDVGGQPAAGWTDLPDDGLRFYADPFPILHQGRVTLFVEEYPHATGKGIISAVAFDRSGPVGRPEPVLERPYHLSYPFVFARDGEVWMIPESGASGTIDLFRATRFPGGWVKERTLVADVTASDATLFERDGRWWMFATVKDGGSHSDMLCLWSAPAFCGPWTPHPRNPVLVDCVSARPAGRMFTRDGRLFRPTQDCRATYGGALALAEVLQLDDDGYRQAIASIVTPGPHWPGRHLHTLNGAGGLQFIDGTGRARRQWLPRRAGAPSGPALQPSAG